MQKTIQTNNTELILKSTLRSGLPVRGLLPLVGVMIEELRKKTHTYTQKQISPSRQLSLSLTICSDHKMKNLNSHYRQKSKTTDVLSFPLYDNLRIVSLESLVPGPVEIGDLFISWPVCLRQSKEFGVTALQEFCHLFVHGYLHLLGYDHEISAEEEKLMQKEEQKVIKNIYQRMNWV